MLLVLKSVDLAAGRQGGKNDDVVNRRMKKREETRRQTSGTCGQVFTVVYLFLFSICKTESHWWLSATRGLLKPTTPPSHPSIEILEITHGFEQTKQMKRGDFLGLNL